MGMVVYSPSRKVAAGVHVLRAQPTEREVPNPAYFATTAISHIVETFKKKGVSGPYSVAIAGGGSMLPTSMGDVGTKLVAAVKGALSQANLPVKLEKTGGATVKTIVLHVDAGKIKITE
ncbi:MAG: hypothetical protein GY868_18490, partial [Deltaproteobacteria bacterium]|nr:hypothetical protein [Deltaproteobacteria bacterium]